MAFHESIKSLPVKQWQFWQKVTEILLNVGQDHEAVLKHIERALYFITNSKNREATEELCNMRQAVKFYFNGLDFNNIALGALKVYDKKASEDDMSETIKYKKQDAVNKHEVIRAKLLSEFEQYFPLISKDDNANEIETLRANAMKLSKSLQEGEEGQSEALISTIIDQHVESIKPKNYTRKGDDWRELVVDKSFEKMNYIVSQHMGGRDISDMTVFEYYTIVSALDEKYKNTIKQQEKIKNGRNKME